MEKQNHSESQIEMLMSEGEKRAYNGRLKRLKFLIGIESHKAFPAPALAVEYLEEARLCWYSGSFVATILMTQLSFEELLKSRYRVVKGVGGKLRSGRKVDNAGFSELINESKIDGWISSEEAESLHNLRENLRNPYVHVKDIRIGKTQKADLTRPSFITQHLKMTAPELIGIDVESEAKEAIRLLGTLFPEISGRYAGL